jgi:tungstate transport system substrate-binding protein
MRPRREAPAGHPVRRLLLLACAWVLAGPTACARPRTAITLATTTSTQDSGLLDVLVPLFRERTGIDVAVVAVGTGQALELGRRGDADALLVHDRPGEDRFMAEGHGDLRRDVMYNDFVLAGPAADPGGLRGTPSIAAAFARIAELRLPFVSRGDESGTHRKELMVWRRAGVEPRGDWYIRAGAGMGQVLRMADQERAHTLSDRATFLALGRGLDLAILSEGDPLLRNPYGVIAVSPAKHPHVRHEGARKFVAFLLSPEAQRTIARFGVDQHGQPLFRVYDADHPPRP